MLRRGHALKHSALFDFADQIVTFSMCPRHTLVALHKREDAERISLLSAMPAECERPF